MHELAIAQNIVDIVQQHVPDGQAAMVRSVSVRVGRLSGVVPESLAFSFEVIVSGTPLESARLDIEAVPLGFECRGCGHQFQSDDLMFGCPACSDPHLQLVSGSDLQVAFIELEEADGVRHES